MKRTLIAALAVTIAGAAASFADGHKSPVPDGASIYFIGLADGDTVASPVTVRFGLSGMGVAPAGASDFDKVGHHHLLIDRAPFGEGADGAEEWEFGIANDDNNRHFGGGQTEVTLDLAPGTHTLQMVLGNHGHVPFGPELATDQITITVE
jgi:hypothetical protein